MQILGPGQFLVPDKLGPHTIGGPNIWNGSECPNCFKPLMTHVILDTSAQALLGIGFPYRRVPLLYCCRCILYRYPFSYQLVSQDAVQIIEVRKELSLTAWEEWQKYTNVGDEIKRQSAALVPMPKRVQEIIDSVNGGQDATDSMREEFANLTAGFREDDSVPWISPLNQVLGRGLALQPGALKVMCSNCLRNGKPRSAAFLCSLMNDETHDLWFTFDGLQLLFFICPECWTIDVSQVL